MADHWNCEICGKYIREDSAHAMCCPDEDHFMNGRFEALDEAKTQRIAKHWGISEPQLERLLKR